jgi:anti-sigma-K factor RskA
MNLGRPDRRERLELLAAENALGTLPPRARARLAAIARRDPVVAAACEEWSRRIALLATALPGVNPPPRVYAAIAKRLGLAGETPDTAGGGWWSRLGVWRGLAVVGFALAVALGISQMMREAPKPGETMVVVLGGADAKPALIATAARGDRFLTMKNVSDASAGAGKTFELWALPEGGKPKSLGLIPAGAMSRIPLSAPPDESLANVPALAVSLEPTGGSPTGQPTGPVLYTGKVERLY